MEPHLITREAVERVVKLTLAARLAEAASAARLDDAGRDVAARADRYARCKFTLARLLELCPDTAIGAGDALPGCLLVDGHAVYLEPGVDGGPPDVQIRPVAGHAPDVAFDAP